jgi:hypothetical protein
MIDDSLLNHQHKKWPIYERRQPWTGTESNDQQSTFFMEMSKLPHSG